MRVADDVLQLFAPFTFSNLSMSTFTLENFEVLLF